MRMSGPGITIPVFSNCIMLLLEVIFMQDTHFDDPDNTNWRTLIITFLTALGSLIPIQEWV